MMAEKPFVFVLMPFDQQFEDTYSLGIKGAVDQAGMLAERVDEQFFHRENIMERIYNQIEAADLIIAEMTGRNPNVFYEVGCAHAKSKLCVLLTKDARDIPFDLQHHRHIIYRSVTDLRSKLLQDLSHLKAELAERGSPIQVSLSSISGDLEKTKYYATAVVTINIDMHNYTKNASPDIEAIYFYTGRNWKFEQDQKECRRAKSDLPDFQDRHFIKSPVQRISQDGWAPIRIIGKKIVATAFKGEILEDSYRLTGYALIKIKTAKGDVESRLDLSVTADDIPF
jgi:nucleoside 2-deoxyribosyltransferase